MKRQFAFSLVELVVVIIILGILSVTVAPKIFGKSSVAHYAVRDQFIAQLRLVQLQAMNQRGICNRLVVTSSYFGIENNTGSVCGPAPDVDDRIELDDVLIQSSTSFTIEFDRQGISDCSPCTYNIIGEETVQVIIEAQGYIHAVYL